MRKFALLSLATDASMVRKPCQPLEGKATQPIKQQAEKGIIICLPDHAFMTRNSNQTTRRSPPRGVDGWA